MSTLGQMIDAVKGGLQSFALDEDQSTTLAANIGSMDLTFTVTTPRGVATGASPGIMEIDEELLYCDTVGSNGMITVTPWGRGYLSTTPAAHNMNARVISQPSYPRAKIKDAINQTMRRAFPDVFAVKQIELTTTYPVFTYSMPNDCQRLLFAQWQLPTAAQEWRTVRRWRQRPGGGTLAGDTTIAIDISDAMLVGRPIQFVYAASPTPLVNETDDFVGVTGFQGSIEDVITLGAQVQLLPGLELSRLQMSSVEQQNRSQLVAPSAALTSTRFLEQRFQTRLQEERATLMKRYPPRVSREWY